MIGMIVLIFLTVIMGLVVSTLNIVLLFDAIKNKVWEGVFLLSVLGAILLMLLIGLIFKSVGL